MEYTEEIKTEADKPNDFQQWLIEQGYYRENGLAWMKDKLLVSGKELYDKLEEWKKSNPSPNK